MKRTRAALIATLSTVFATASCELIVAPDHSKIPSGAGGATGSGGASSSSSSSSTESSSASSTASSSSSSASSTSSSASSSSTGGGCDPTACAAQDSDCVKHTCSVSGVCVAMNVAQGGAVAQQTPGDCHKNQCNGQGSIEVVVDDTDVPPSTDCTVGSCNQGAKVFTNKPINTACGMNNTLKCDGAGMCVGCTAASQCPTPTNQCAAAACTGGMCGSANKADGSTCNDGNACTQTDTCQAGVCTGSNPVVCKASDACHVAGTCDMATGMCSNPAAPNGSTCNDGNACTQTDTCQAGVCTGSNPVVCKASDACHVAGTCDMATGLCSNPPIADGTACNDGKSCTLAAACTLGVCGATSSVTCTTNVCGSSLDAFTGTQTAGWKLNGSATYDAVANTLVLADGSVKTGQAGTVFYQDPIVADAFTVSFDFRINSAAPYSRADGIAFALQTNGATALGGGYGGFGVLGLTGYGVEIDAFDSGPCDPGNGNHAGVDSLASCSTNVGIPSALATSTDLSPMGVGDIADGAWRTATIQLASGQLSVSITNATGTPIAVTNLQNVALTGFVSGTPYYIGFGGGTGSNGLAAHEEIRNVHVTFPAKHCL